MRIDFLSIFIHCGITKYRKNGKYFCQFCKTWNFEFQREEATCSCSSCNFSGNAIEFYAKLKDIPGYHARRELLKLLEDGSICLIKRTRQEAVSALSKDLEFLAWVRMYWAFYGHSRENQEFHQQNSGIAKTSFNRVINGDISNVAQKPWNEAIEYLKSAIDIDAFKQDLAKGALFFEPEANELLYSKTQLRKFQ